MTTTTKTLPFDSAEYLDTPEAIAAYLDDALASGSAAEFQSAQDTAARARHMIQDKAKHHPQG